MNNFVKTFLACLLALVIKGILSLFFWILLFGSLATFGEEKVHKVTKGTILKIDLGTPYPEYSVGNPLNNLDINSMKIKSTTTLYEAVSLIHRAAEDPNIDGIYISSPLSSPISFSGMYELRQALEQFRSTSNKFVIAYGDTYNQNTYYLASCADKIYLNPQGALDWRGLSSTVYFLKGTLNKLGIEPEIFRHGQYKAAIEPYLLDKMSPENREQTQAMLNSIWEYVVDNVSQSRQIDRVQLQQLASNMAITTAQDAFNHKMVDSLAYTDQILDQLGKLTNNEEPKFVTLAQYRSSNRTATKGNILSNDKIAVVFASGDIVDGGDTTKEIVGNHLASLIRSARKDKNVKAVVLRVNSPGGSVLASDIIWREVELTRQQKPVIVSMGTYAASGGYYISCPADAIVTTPTTITGSIGVFGMMFNMEKTAKENLGVTFDVVRTNPMADIGSAVRPMTSPERTIIQNSVDSVYTRFVGLVSQGRDLQYTTVDNMAGGRIWSGLQAIDLKLADKIGTLDDAIKLAAEKASISDYAIETWPQPDESLEALINLLGESAVATIKASIGIPKQVDAVKEYIDRNQGILAKLPFEITIE